MCASAPKLVKKPIYLATFPHETPSFPERMLTPFINASPSVNSPPSTCPLRRFGSA